MPIPAFSVYATGDTIEAAWANDLKDAIQLLDSRTGGDPGGSGKVIESTSSTAGGWVAANLAKVASWLGYTPANKAGDTFTGSVSVSGATSDLSVGRNIVATGALTAASVSSGGAIATVAGTISTGGTVSGATISATNVAASSSLKRGGVEAALVGHTHGGSEITDLSLTDADIASANKDGSAVTPSMRTIGTAALQAAAGNHAHAAGDAATLDGIDSTGFSLAAHTHSYGNASATTVTYAGNSAGTRVISLSPATFTPMFAMIQNVAGGGNTAQWFFANHDGIAITSGSPGTVGTTFTGLVFAAGQVTVPSSLNTTGVTYRITAFGT